MALPYFIMGILFTYLAFLSVTDTVWNTITILMALIATFDFVIGIHFLRMHFKQRK